MTLRPLALLALALPLLAARSDPLAGRIAGEPQRCITLSSTNGPSTIDARTILYTEGAGRRIWKTGPVGDCPSLEPLTTLIVDVYGGQLCRNDRFRVLTPGTTIPSAYCRFTEFTPYTRPDRTRKPD
ncbi:hypothetical protein FHT00_000024 [Sphingomonas insulae]|uniref:Uncharacterized protein n=1 Tax=Sphingomonas insulae TaxID=424800 RepID=A0ABN1HTF5_9SPHN|nr:hypothetical protein [Sphingomonas insulae]NIJ28096.1 hypothetical protein [Sphingomonas insulae]